MSWRPARAQRRSDPSSRVLAARGGRHLGSLGKRHPSRGGAGRCALSGLLVASLLLQVASRQSCQRPGCPETAKEGNLRRPSPCDGNRAALDSFGATSQVTGPSLGPPTFAPFAGHWPGRSGGIARVKPSAVHVGGIGKPVTTPSGAGGENVGGAARIEGASPARTALSPAREVRSAKRRGSRPSSRGDS